MTEQFIKCDYYIDRRLVQRVLGMLLALAGAPALAVEPW